MQLGQRVGGRTPATAYVVVSAISRMLSLSPARRKPLISPGQRRHSIGPLRDPSRSVTGSPTPITHHTEDCLLPLKQTVRHPFEPPTKLHVTGRDAGGGRLGRLDIFVARSSESTPTLAQGLHEGHALGDPELVGDRAIGRGTRRPQAVAAAGRATLKSPPSPAHRASLEPLNRNPIGTGWDSAATDPLHLQDSAGTPRDKLRGNRGMAPLRIVGPRTAGVEEMRSPTGDDIDEIRP